MIASTVTLVLEGTTLVTMRLDVWHSSQHHSQSLYAKSVLDGTLQCSLERLEMFSGWVATDSASWTQVALTPLRSL